MPDGAMIPAKTFQWEQLRDLLREPNVRELIAEHWEESGVDKGDVPLDIDWPTYEQWDAEGRLKMITARRDGCLIGYMAWFISFPPNYRTTLHAFQGAWNMASLLPRSLPGLKEMGVKRVVAHDKLHVAESRGTVAPVFGRAGFRETERVWYKVL